jgi:hypothetical protein
MFLPQQFTGQGPQSPCAPCVPPAPAGNITVNWPTSSSSTPYGQIPCTPVRPPIILPMKRSQPAAVTRDTNATRILDLPPSSKISHDEFDAVAESDYTSDSDGAEGNTLISSTQMAFSL